MRSAPSSSGHISLRGCAEAHLGARALDDVEGQAGLDGGDDAVGRAGADDHLVVAGLVEGAASERARKRAEGTGLAIGYSDPNDLLRLAPVLDRLRRERPAFHVTLSLGPRDSNVEKLSREQLDIVLGFKSASHEAPNVLFRPLRTDGLNCIVRKDSPLATLEEVGLDEVTGYPRVVCLPASIRRKGSAAQGSIPRTDDEHTVTCSTTTEASALVDAGFGYALVPAIETMPDPNQKALVWKGGAKATFGAYVRDDTRGDLVSRFLEAAEEEYASIKP